MERKPKYTETFLLYIGLFLYALLLIQALFLKKVSYNEIFLPDREIYRSITLIPFKTIGYYVDILKYSTNAQLILTAKINLIGNVALFFPLGIYLRLFKNDSRISINLLIILLSSVAVEIIQYVLALGYSDIDDVILNMLGGVLGILFYKLLIAILKTPERARTATVFFSTVTGILILVLNTTILSLMRLP